MKKPYKFTFIPDGKNKILKYYYDNITGNEILDKKLFTIKKQFYAFGDLKR